MIFHVKKSNYPFNGSLSFSVLIVKYQKIINPNEKKMKIILLTLFFLLSLFTGQPHNSVAQKGKVSGHAKKTAFSIKGEVDNLVQADSFFIYSMKQEALAGGPVVNGKFELNGSVSEPTVAFIGAPNGYVAQVILENADYTYTNKNGRIIVKGGPLHDLVLGFESGDEYNTVVETYTKQQQQIMDQGKGPEDITPKEQQQLDKAFQLALEIENRNLNKVVDDPKSPVMAKAFAVFRSQQWERYPYEKRIALLQDYEKQLGGSQSVAALRGVFEQMLEEERAGESVQTDMMFKDVEAKDVNGQVVKLSDVIAKNEFTILEFWASWCGPCRGEVPNLKKAYEKYKSKGLEIYSVSIDAKEAQWLKALKDENMPWINVRDSKENGAASIYGVSGVPASFLIGKDGKIVATGQELRGAALEKTLSDKMP